MKKEDMEIQIVEVSKILRNCRKIEHRIHQLQKQLYLGHTSAYNIIMRMIYPNYDEFKKETQIRFHNRPLAGNSKLDKIEGEIKNASGQPDKGD